jgi:hypothetical protein
MYKVQNLLAPLGSIFGHGEPKIITDGEEKNLPIVKFSIFDAILTAKLLTSLKSESAGAIL